MARRKSEQKHGLGMIQAAAPPAAGTVFVLDVPEGTKNPTGETTASLAGHGTVTSADRFELEIVEGDIGDDVVCWVDRRGDSEYYDDLTIERWNREFAQFVVEVRPPAAAAGASKDAAEPDHDTVVRCVAHAICRVAGAPQRWIERAKAGMSDKHLKAFLGEELGISGGSTGPNGTSIAFRGGKDPAIWIGRCSPVGKPTLSGNTLLVVAREALRTYTTAGAGDGTQRPAAAGGMMADHRPNVQVGKLVPLDDEGRPRKKFDVAASCIGKFSASDPWPEGTTIVLENADGQGGGTLELREVDLELKLLVLRAQNGSRKAVGFDEWNIDYASAVTEVRFGDRSQAASPASSESSVSSVADASISSSTPPAAAKGSPRADLVMVPIDRIDATHNIRRRMDKGSLLRLAQSIRDVGLLQPVIVREVSQREFRLVAGHRRLEAAISAGEELVEAKLYRRGTVDDRWEAKARLAENRHRDDLTHMELAREYGESVKRGLSPVEIALEAKDSDDTVRRHLSLLRLCPPVAELVDEGKLPVHQAELIARVGDVARQISLAERCLALDWDDKRGTWKAKPHFNWKEGDPKDYLMPMDDLRKEVAVAMCGLAACGWLRYEQENSPAGAEGTESRDLETPLSREGGIAAMRACEGCPDNTMTYADQPTLFAGIRPQGSDKKGYCTNRPCYEAKAKVWEKVTARRKKEQEKEQARKITQARKAGLDVCEGFPSGGKPCGRLADAGTSFPACKAAGGAKLCPACAKKAQQRKGSGGGFGDTYERKRAAVRAAQDSFGSKSEEALALALWQHLGQCVKAVAVAIATLKGDMITREIVEAALLASIDAELDRNKTLPTLKGIISGKERFVPAALAAIWLEASMPIEWDGPKIDDYDGKVCNVPLGKQWMEAIEQTEYFGQCVGAKIPPRPTERSIATEGLRQRILTADQDGLGAVLDSVAPGDWDVLDDLLREAAEGELELGGKKVKVPKWRDKAIMARLGQLKGFVGDPRPVAKALADDKHNPATSPLVSKLTDGSFLRVMDGPQQGAILRVASKLADGALEVRWPDGRLDVVETQTPVAPATAAESARWYNERDSRYLNRVRQGSKRDALEAIGESLDGCEEWFTPAELLALLRSAKSLGLSGDWRRAVVEDRIKALAGNEAAAADVQDEDLQDGEDGE